MAILDKVSGRNESPSPADAWNAEIIEIKQKINELAFRTGKDYLEADGQIDEEKKAEIFRAYQGHLERIDELQAQIDAFRHQRRCPVCSNVVGEDAKFCIFCGNKLPASAQRICKTCGRVLDAEERFCMECGTKYEEAEEVVEAAPVSAQPVEEAAPVSSQPAEEAVEVAEFVIAEPVEEDEAAAIEVVEE